MIEKKLHILFLCGWYPSRVLPNNGDFIQRHAEAVALKHQVSVLHIITDPNLTKTFEFSFTEIHQVKTTIAYIKPAKNPITKGLRFFKAFLSLTKTIGKFDLVHLNKLFPFGLFALFLKWFYNKPFLISEHWTGYHSPLVKQLSKTEIILSKLIAKQASFICPVSNNLKDAMIAAGLLGNYQRIPNVVDTGKFVVSPDKNSTFTILHVSNMLDMHKNVSGILKAVKQFSKQISGFQLILIGENALQYKRLAKELNLLTYVQFLEHQPHHEIIKHLQEAHVFVLFSNYENLPCVILESFACGTPVISTNVGGVSEYFPDDFGFLIEPNNTTRLAKKLVELYNVTTWNTKKMHVYAENNFSNESIAEAFDSLYLQMLSKKVK